MIRLLELLDGLKRHPFLKPRIVLKGGTALNIFIADLPRLSVDIDLNYIGTGDRETMLSERPKIEQAIQAVCGRFGIQVKRAPVDHAGGKWRLSYTSVFGRAGTLELDVNFMLRTPLWPTVTVASRPLGAFQPTQARVLDIHELAAGKMAALLARSASRDLFDVRQLLNGQNLDHAKLRVAFVIYGGINRKAWRDANIGQVQANPGELDQMLLPMLRADLIPAKEQIGDWTKQLVEDCQRLFAAVLPLNSNEMMFLDRLNDNGVIEPELITDDDQIKNVIQTHPGLLWKALNVRKHKHS